MGGRGCHVVETLGRDKQPEQERGHIYWASECRPKESRDTVQVVESVVATMVGHSHCYERARSDGFNWLSKQDICCSLHP